MPGSDDQDRRDSTRAPVELRVEYRGVNVFFSDYTRNISKGGTFIQTTKPLPVGTLFVFQLVVPRFDQPIELDGEVRWIIAQEEATDDKPAGMGIAFQFRNDGQREAIAQTVQRMMVEELGERMAAGLLEESQQKREG